MQVQQLLARRWSPEQISRALQVDSADDPARRLANGSIYQAIYDRPASWSATATACRYAPAGAAQTTPSPGCEAGDEAGSPSVIRFGSCSPREETQG